MMTKIEMQAMESVKGIHREMKKQNETNWERRRYEIAKDTLVGMLSNPSLVVGVSSEGEPVWNAPVPIVNTAVAFADLLIEKLKGGSDEETEESVFPHRNTEHEHSLL